MRKNRWKRATKRDKRKRNLKKWRRHHEPEGLKTKVPLAPVEAPVKEAPVKEAQVKEAPVKKAPSKKPSARKPSRKASA